MMDLSKKIKWKYTYSMMTIIIKEVIYINVISQAEK